MLNHTLGSRRRARSQRLLDEAAAARAEARALRSAPSGPMRVAVPESFGERYTLPGIGGFLARFPSVRVELVSGARHTRLVEEEFDLAIRISFPRRRMASRSGGRALLGVDLAIATRST